MPVQGQKYIQFYIKWLGYDKESDNTWEDEENCEGSEQLINEYWAANGGKPSFKQGPGRKRNLSTPASDGAGAKKRRESVPEEKAPVQQKATDISTWKPPADLENWDDKVSYVDTVERTDNGLVLVYLQWYLMS